MTVKLRPYKSDEFERSVEIRNLTGAESINRWRSRFEKSGTWDDHYLHLAIVKDDLLVGDLQLRHCNYAMPDGALEIGIEIDQKYQAQGIGSEVLKLAAAKFFAEGAHRISGSTATSNLAMIGAFKKAGWVFEGTLYGLFKQDGKLIDYESYAIIN
jgi:RimJ/RimL family protein N-acetyltransferase